LEIAHVDQIFNSIGRHAYAIVEVTKPYDRLDTFVSSDTL
jgi:hypothetical protein